MLFIYKNKCNHTGTLTPEKTPKERSYFVKSSINITVNVYHCTYTTARSTNIDYYIFIV